MATLNYPRRPVPVPVPAQVSASTSPSAPAPAPAPPPPPPPLAPQPRNRYGDAGEIFNPSLVNLYFGRTVKPYSSPHPIVYFTPIKWFWFPGFGIDLRLLFNSLLIVLLVAIILVAALVDNNAGRLAGVFVLLGIEIIVIYLRTNIAINQVLRTAICRCYAKRELALKVWKSADRKDAIYAKDIFHDESSFFCRIVVLRDGTVEIRHTFTKDDVHGGSGSEYPQVLQAGVENFA